MNRLKWLVWLNLVLFCSALVQIITGVMLFFNLFTTRLELISELHEYNGLLFSGLVLIHLWFNWSWIKANFFKPHTVSVK